MSKTQRHPSYMSCVENVLSRSPAPLTVDALIEQVRQERPVGKAVRSQVYQAISKLFQAIPVAPGRYGWLSTLLKGQTFRHPLNPFELQRGTLLLDELEHAVFFPQFFQEHEPDSRTIYIQLMGGPTLEVQATIEQETWALHLAAPFQKWVDELGGSANDDLLIYVEDAGVGKYLVRLQPREARREDEVMQRNMLLVQAAESIVAGDRKVRDAVPVWELAAMLIGRGLYADATPPDDMHFVLHKYSRLQLVPEGYLASSRRSGQRRAAGADPEEDWALAGRLSPFWLDADAERDGFETGAGGDMAYSDDSLIDDPFMDDLLLDDILFGSGAFESDMAEDDMLVDAEESDFFLGQPDLFSDVDTCEAYQMYLDEFRAASPGELPLRHMDFHLLEAELEMLVGLEQEFGYLMPEQEARKQQLAARLFIDLDLFYGNDWDQWDQTGWDDPSFPDF